MKLFSEHFVEAKEKAINFLDQITLSSRLASMPDKATLAFLRATVKPGKYVVYRGLGLTDKKTPLEIGEPVPPEFVKPNGAQIVIHTSKSLGVAKTYGRGLGVIYKITCDASQVMFDGTNMAKAFPEIDQDITDYFKQEKEILLFRDAFMTTEIVVITGR